MEKIELEVMGITAGQIQSNVYALQLREVNGNRRVPIVIGAPEAQSIALRLEGIIPPRPLNHDLTTSVLHAFGIEMTEVMITRFEQGVFYSELSLVDTEGRQVAIDARVSDAIALALRTGARIFTTPEVMDKTSFAIEEYETATGQKKEPPRLEDMSDERLQHRLKRAVERENYELAATIQRILQERKR